MEVKRVELKPVEPATQPKKDKKVVPTFRFNLTLTESTDKICPEFSYTELMKNALGKEGDDDFSLDPLDPFSKQDRQEEDKLQALAKSFEDKYSTGIKPSTKRKRKDHPGDLVDLGEGYDLEDPFIDNTEAYDEVIPSNMTTHLGGFYINSGALDFKYCSDDSDADFAAPKKKKKRVVIISDSESEGGEKKKKKKVLEGGLLKKKLKKSLSTDSENSDKLLKKKKKLVSSEKIKLAKLKKNRPSMYLKKQQQNQLSGGQQENSSTGASSTPSVMVNGEGAAASANQQSHSQEATPSGELTGESDTQGRSTPAKQVTISVVLDDISSNQAPKAAAVPSTDNKPMPDTADAEDQECVVVATQKPKLEAVVTLPDTLSLKTLSNIEKLKQAAKEKGTESGKGKFFSQGVNDMLLSIEKDTRQSSLSERSAVYSHLAGHLPCSKETLLKRGKKLLQEQQDDKLREPINKLKEAVIASMPALHEKHAADCAAAQSKQQVKQNKVEKKEGGPGSSDSEEEISNDGSEKPKRLVMPRKKFEWTPHLRQLLCSIVVLKMEHYEMSKVRSQSPEEYLKAFLDAEIKPLWPQGWIQTRMLFKESRSVHSKWTNPQSKPKKMVLPLKNTPNPVSAPSKQIGAQNLSQAVTGLPKPNPQTLTQGSSSVNKLEERPVSHSAATNHHGGLYASPDLQKKSDAKSVKPVATKADSSVLTLLDYAEKSTYSANDSLAQASSQKTSAQKSSSNTIASSTTGSSGVKPAQTSSMKVGQTDSVASAKKQSGSKPVTPSSNTALTAEKAAAQDFLQKFKDFTNTFTHQQQQPFVSYAMQQALSQAGVGTMPSSTNPKSTTNPMVDTTAQKTNAQKVQQVAGNLSTKPSQYSVKPVSKSTSLLATSLPKPSVVNQKGASPANKLIGVNEASPNTSRQPKAPVISVKPLQLVSSAPSVMNSPTQLSQASNVGNKTSLQAANVAKTTPVTSGKGGAINKVTIPVSTIKVVTTADGKTIRIANPVKVATANSTARQAVDNKPDRAGIQTITTHVQKLSGKPPTLVANQVKGQTAQQNHAPSGSPSVGSIVHQKTPAQVAKPTNQGLVGAGIRTSPLQQQAHHQKAQVSSQQDRQQHKQQQQQNSAAKPLQHSVKQTYPTTAATAGKPTNPLKLPKPSLPPSQVGHLPHQSTSPKHQHHHQQHQRQPQQQQPPSSPQISKPRSPKTSNTFGGMSLEELQRQMLQKEYTAGQSSRSQVPPPSSPSSTSHNAFNPGLTANNLPYGSPTSATAAFTSMLNRISQGSEHSPAAAAANQLVHTSPSNTAERYQQASGYVQPSQCSPHTSPTAGRSSAQGLFPAHSSPSPTRPGFSPYGYTYPNTDPSQQQYRY